MADRTRYSCLYVRKIPRSLHDIFAAHCRRRGVLMKDAIIDLMRKAVDRDRLHIPKAVKDIKVP